MTAAAISSVLGGPSILLRVVDSDDDLRSITREGMPVATLTVLAAELALDRKSFAHLVGISDRTLSRRLASRARLSTEESDRVVRIARVLAQATDTLGDPAKATHWLKEPNLALNGQTPLGLLDTEGGARSVETVLLRIEYGIYS